MVFGLKAKALIGTAVAASLVAAGWQSRAWYEDSVTLSVERALADVKHDNDESIAAIARRVEQQLADTAVKERVIDRGIIRETSKVEYRDRECFGPELVRLLNLGARGAAADVSGELAGQVPGGAAGAD
jgi:hypothetical protein